MVCGLVPASGVDIKVISSVDSSPETVVSTEVVWRVRELGPVAELVTFVVGATDVIGLSVENSVCDVVELPVASV